MSISARVRVSGPLAQFTEAFGAEMRAHGYTDLSLANHLRLMAALSRWLDVRGLSLGALSGDEVDRFLARRRQMHSHHVSERGLAPLLTFLRRLRVLPSEPAPAPRRSELLGRYERYLTDQRAVSPAVRKRYIAVASDFMDGRSAAALTAKNVAKFAATCASQPSLAGRLSALRSLLRFLFVTGETAANLVYAVPSAPRWRLAGLPKALSSAEVRALLATCDRRTTVGLRNYAALLLMLRLGLRAGEVAALQLDDIDWRSAELVVRGKGGTISKLPLPVDIGEAVAAYLRRPRRQSATRSVFVQMRAPFRPAIPGTIIALASAAFEAAGIEHGGAHRLRHTAATQMLQMGASLTEIAQVLRHRHFDTTAIYAKVDRARLRDLAHPWPTPERRDGLRELAQRWPGGAA